MSQSSLVASGKATESSDPPTSRPSARLRPKASSIAGFAFLLLALGTILYALYAYHFRTVLTMKLPEHEPLAVDSPPIELTSFQVRAGGELLVPASVAIGADTVFLAFADKPLVYLYSGELELLRRIELSRPETVCPTAVAVADSLLLVADSSRQTLAVYDHEGYYLTSSAWYPMDSGRINPRHISSNHGMLTLTDHLRRRVSVISLVEQPPFYTFLELIRTIPDESMACLPGPSCAIMTPDSNVWVGDGNLRCAFIFRPGGRILTELEQPRLSRITFPADFAYMEWNGHAFLGAAGSTRAASARVHLLDRGAGKVFVYDLSGRLTLVYPRERELQGPVSLAVNAERRHIYVAEAVARQVTVFGY